MKFSCEKDRLYAAISTCMHAVSSKSPAPVLEGLLLRADEDRLTLCGYNYKTSIRASLDVSVYVPGALVINARILSDIIKRLQGDIVEIAAEGDAEVRIRCGISDFRLTCMPARDFPDPPNIRQTEGIELPSGLLKSMIEDTIFAISENQSKPVHTGALFEIEDGVLTVVGVDGYRLAIRRTHLEKPCENRRFVVPGEALREIMRILPDTDDLAEILPDKRFALIRTGDIIITTRLLEGDFIEYRKTLPQDFPVRLRVDRRRVIETIERVSILITERLKNPVRCLFEGELLKISCQTQIGSSYDECPIPPCSERIEIGFNSRYLLDALRACRDDECIIELKSGLSPCTVLPVEGDSFLYLVLPVRLRPGE